MVLSGALIAFFLCSAAVHAEELEPLISRPITLPRGKVDLTVHGTYTNWGTGLAAGGGPGSLSGETLAVGADFGATDRVQLGLAVALPVNPGAGFGTVLGSAAVSVERNVALRFDAGFENFGFNGDSTIVNPRHINRFFGGVGVPIKVPITPTVAFVMGRTGALQFGHFNNIGDRGIGLYVGGSLFTEASSDFLVVSGGSDNSGTNIGINLPAGLLLQPDPHLALTLQAGYSALVEVPSTGSSVALHFIPVGMEAVLTPMPLLDIGARFFLDGYVAQSGGSSSGNPGYFDLRALMLWVRFHA